MLLWIMSFFFLLGQMGTDSNINISEDKLESHAQILSTFLLDLFECSLFYTSKNYTHKIHTDSNYSILVPQSLELPLSVRETPWFKTQKTVRLSSFC